MDEEVVSCTHAHRTGELEGGTSSGSLAFEAEAIKEVVGGAIGFVGIDAERVGNGLAVFESALVMADDIGSEDLLQGALGITLTEKIGLVAGLGGGEADVAGDAVGLGDVGDQGAVTGKAGIGGWVPYSLIYWIGGDGAKAPGNTEITGLGTRKRLADGVTPNVVGRVS